MGDKPELVSFKAKKMKGKALSLLTHLRNVGFYLHDFAISSPGLYESDAFSQLMALSSIVEKVMAYEIRKYEVVALDEEVVDYLNKRQELFLKYERLIIM